MAAKVCIYQILNTVNGKCYIGQTRDVKHRFASHLSLLRRNSHHSATLQKAWNKYGEAAFQFRVLIIPPPDSDVDAIEIEYITRHDSRRNGYNMTSGGEGGPVRLCVWNGVEYPSISTAAKALNVSIATMSERIATGRTNDDDIAPRRRHKEFILDGVAYSSAKEAATYLNTTESHVYWRLNKKRYEGVEPPKAKQEVTWNSVTYPSLTAAAKATNQSRQGLADRLAKGFASDEDVKTEKQKQEVTWNGITYPSISAAARALNIGVTPMWNRLKNGYTCDADMVGRGHKIVRKPQLNKGKIK